jgi:hypothetical protein
MKVPKVVINKLRKYKRKDEEYYGERLKDRLDDSQLLRTKSTISSIKKGKKEEKK